MRWSMHQLMKTLGGKNAVKKGAQLIGAIYEISPGRVRFCLDASRTNLRGTPYSIAISKALSRFATEGLRVCADVLGSAFRGQSSLEVFRVHACFCPLLPSHLWSLRPVHFDELSFCWSSGEGEESGALCDMSTGRLGPCPCLFLRELFLRLP